MTLARTTPVLVVLFLGSAALAAPPAAPLPTLSVGIKSIKLGWSTVTGATSYRVYEDATGSSGFVQLGSDIAQPATTPSRVNYTRTVSVHRLDWGGVLYRVDSCNASGCSSSASLTTSDSLSAIGYVKPATVTGGDEFGRAVAVSADGATVAVGVPYQSGWQGAVRVFVRTGTSWSEQALRIAPVPASGALLGYSVSLSDDGNTLAAAAQGETYRSGAVYVFTRTGTTWSAGVRLVPTVADTGDVFGFSVALGGDGLTLVVGAPSEAGADFTINGNASSDAAPASGAAYVFVLNAGAWSQQAYLKASNGAAGSLFGVSVAASSNGNTVAVGSSAYSSQAGEVTVFTRSGTTWTQQANLQTTTPTALDQLGCSVTLSGTGDLLAAGASGRSGGQGAVYLFSRTGTTWSQAAELVASVQAAGDAFGFSVSLGRPGNGLLVGAPSEDGTGVGVTGTPGVVSSASNASGAAYVFTPGSSGVWTQTAYLKSPAPGGTDEFGISVAHSSGGATLVVGASLEDGSTPGVNTNTAVNDASADAGAVYLF